MCQVVCEMQSWKVNEHLPLTDDEDEESGGCHETKVLGCASDCFSHMGLAVGVVVEVFPDAVSPDFLIHVGRQLHLHLAVIALQVLGQVETCVGVGLPIKLE